MLTKLFNLLPAQLVERIACAAFKNLQDRGVIRTWIVGYSPDKELTYECNGLSIQILETSNSWDWKVLDGFGIDIVESGKSLTKEAAMLSAETWINCFLDN
jgi:hypothetical protein